jgi:hypothetical protein
LRIPHDDLPSSLRAHIAAHPDDLHDAETSVHRFRIAFANACEDLSQ